MIRTVDELPPPEAAEQSLFARATALVRRIIGVPDYDIYCKHMAVSHPGQALLSEPEFVEERMRDKYSKPGQRCC